MRKLSFIFGIISLILSFINLVCAIYNNNFSAMFGWLTTFIWSFNYLLTIK